MAYQEKLGEFRNIKNQMKINFQPKHSNFVRDIMGWMKVVVYKDEPLSIVTDSFWIGMLKCGRTQIALNTFKKYLLRLKAVVQEKIRSQLPEQFGLMLDGWSKHNGHYLAIYGSYMDDNGKLQVPLLSMSPLTEEDNMGNQTECIQFRAAEHASHIQMILERDYGKTVKKNVTHVGGDHVTSNIKLAEEQLKKPMVGCRSHRQSLELNRMMSKVSVVKNVVQTCHKVMRKASTNKVAAELRNTTNLRAKLYNKTLWRGKFETVKQYLKMEPALKKASGMEELMIQDEEDEFERQELEEEDDNGKTFKFKRCNREEYEKVLKMLNAQDVVCVKLQAQGLTLAQAARHITTAGQLLTKPDFGGDSDSEDNETDGQLLSGGKYKLTHMSPDYTKARVGKLSHQFEAAVIKLQNGQDLDQEDVKALRMFKKQDAPDSPKATQEHEDSDDSDPIEHASKKRRSNLLATLDKERNSLGEYMNQTEEQGTLDPAVTTEEAMQKHSNYIDPRFVLGTTVEVERFFSLCGNILTDTRSSLSPEMFECIVFLKVHKDKWGLDEVAKAVSKKN